MKSEKLQDAIGMIGEDLIADARTVTEKAKPQWIKWTAMAAAMVMAVVLMSIPFVKEEATFIVKAITQRTIRFPESGIREVQVAESDAATDSQINIQRDLSLGEDYERLSVCYSKEFDVLYYINFSDNKFIYRLKDDEVKVAVEIPANHLYMYNGDLYFRVEGGRYNLKDMNAGDICRYSPLTGEVTKLVEGMESTWMTVAEDSIYFETRSSVFRYDLNNGLVEKVKAYSNFILWKEDYCVVPYVPNIVGGKGEGIRGLGLHKIGEDYSDVEPLIVEGRNNIYSIDGNILYCTGIDYFNVIHLDTGEIKKYAYPSGSTGSFGVHGNRAYQQNLNYFIDLETGKNYKLFAEGSEELGYISRLFSVNGKLYGIHYKMGYYQGVARGTGEIIEITVEEEPTWLQKGEIVYGEVVLYSWKRIGE